ncbi:hypothetical protein P4N68_07745 [Corynebacterium felinum]|uniref:Uncharacterized protein n=1 Tax=Corynebacterium felinum TaxID=131318 RepID=A0ABU2B7Y5_9CORY|nr:hypothetical protein [Corynebacterium felinum]MDF5820970.1 hypothetical protein [Corynebacterium felinum]MDR7354715.1 hypothetical protein [Corynebacterium felinum]
MPIFAHDPKHKCINNPDKRDAKNDGYGEIGETKHGCITVPFSSECNAQLCFLNAKLSGITFTQSAKALSGKNNCVRLVDNSGHNVHEHNATQQLAVSRLFPH